MPPWRSFSGTSIRTLWSASLSESGLGFSQPDLDQLPDRLGLGRDPLAEAEVGDCLHHGMRHRYQLPSCPLKVDGHHGDIHDNTVAFKTDTVISLRRPSAELTLTLTGMVRPDRCGLVSTPKSYIQINGLYTRPLTLVQVPS
jgi:hypothetical protein